MSWQLLTIPPPEWTNNTKFTPPQRAGLRYQRRVSKWLRQEARNLNLTLHSGPWLIDPATDRPCQPDFLLESPGQCLLLIEVKLTQVDCTPQFTKYRRALRLPNLPCIQICRRLTSPATLRDLIDFHHGGVMLVYL